MIRFAVSFSAILTAALGLFPPVASAERVKVLYFERPPYYATVAGKPDGFLVHLARDVFAAAKLDPEFQEMPASRIMKEIKTSPEPVCSIGWFKTAEREKSFRFSLPIYQDMPPLAVFLKTGRQPPAGITTLAGLAETDLTLGVIDAFSYGPAVDALVASLRSPAVRVNGSQEQLARMLGAKRFDFLLVNPEEVDVLARQGGLRPGDLVRVRLTDLPRGNKRYLIFSKSTSQATVDRVNDAIEKLVGVE